MNDSGYRCLTSVVDIRHGTGDSSGGRNTSEQRSYDIGCSLCNQFCIGIVAVAITPSATVADNSDSIAPNTAMVIATGNNSLIASQSNAGTTASGNSDLMVKRSPIVWMQSIPPKFHQVNGYRDYDDGNQRAGNFL